MKSSNDLIIEKLLEQRDLNLNMLKHLDFELIMDPTEKEVHHIKILQNDTIEELKKLNRKLLF